MNEIELDNFDYVNFDFKDSNQESSKGVDSKTPTKAKKDKKRNPPSPQWAYAI